MSFTTSPNMNLTIPGVLSELGPLYASEINASLGLVDAHDHSSGKGIPVTPAGLNINSDVSFGSNNATLLRTSRFSSQSVPITAAADVGCLYVVGNELYYNDFTGGHQIQVTNSGNVNAGAGSITGLSGAPSASASYNNISGTFVWQSGLNVAANMDAQTYIYRNSGASSFGLTVQAPTLVANSSLTLPTPVGAQSFLAVDPSGIITGFAPVALGITTSMLAAQAVTAAKIANTTITAAQIANTTVTATQIANNTITTGQVATFAVAGTGITPAQLDSTAFFVQSASSGSFSTTSTTSVVVASFTNLGPGTRAPGRPVFISFSGGSMSYTGPGSVTITCTCNHGGGPTTVWTTSISGGFAYPASAFNAVDYNNIGTLFSWVYELRAFVTGGGTFSVSNTIMQLGSV